MLGRFVYERYGSKKGMYRSIGYRLLVRAGGLKNFPAVHPRNDQRLVFVCSGNICRSPLAEAYAKKLGREAASCGLDCAPGFPADPRSKAFGQKYGIDLEEHLTVNLRDFQFRADDFIVVMEPAQLSAVRSHVTLPHQLVLAGRFLNQPNPYIHDPFNCCAEFFNNCGKEVLNAVRGICAYSA